MSMRRCIAVLGSLSVFGPLSMDLYLPALPELASDLSTTHASAQLTMSACMLGLGAGQLIAGPLSDRFGRRIPLICGIALFSVLSLLCAIAPTIEALVVARFLQGLAGSAGVVISMATARDMFSGAELSRMMSLLTLVSSGAPILAPVLGGQLLHFMTWRGLFVVLALLSATLCLVAVTSLRETLAPTLRHRGGLKLTVRQFGAVARDTQYRLIIVVAAIMSIVFFTYLSMSPFVFQLQFGVSPAAFSLLFAANSIAILAGTQLSGALVRRLGPRRIYQTSLVCAAIGATALGAASFAGAGFATYAALLSVLMFTQGFSGPNGSTMALHHHAGRAGTASSVYGFTMFAAGPVVVPIIASIGTSAQVMATTMAVGSVIAAAWAFFALRPVLKRNGL